jgi:hypothetical protein
VDPIKQCFESESAFAWVVFRIQERQNKNIPCSEELDVPPEARESSPEVNKKTVLKGPVARDEFLTTKR